MSTSNFQKKPAQAVGTLPSGPGMQARRPPVSPTAMNPGARVVATPARPSLKAPPPAPPRLPINSTRPPALGGPPRASGAPGALGGLGSGAPKKMPSQRPVAPFDPAIDAICASFEHHLPVLVSLPFERRGYVFVHATGPSALQAQFLVRFARKSPDIQRGPAVEIVFSGTNRVPHGYVGQLQKLMAAQKTTDEYLRGLRSHFGDSEARLTVPFEVSLEEPEITSMAAAAKLSALIDAVCPLLGKIRL